MTQEGTSGRWAIESTGSLHNKYHTTHKVPNVSTICFISYKVTTLNRGTAESWRRTS